MLMLEGRHLKEVAGYLGVGLLGWSLRGEHPGGRVRVAWGIRLAPLQAAF